MSSVAAHCPVLRRWTFAAEPASVGALRARLRDAAGGTPGIDWAALALIVSELATNAVRHGAGDRFAVELRVGASTLELTVSNDGAPFAAAPDRPPLEHAGGRGLWIVGQLADAWRLETACGRVRVWVQLPLR